MAEDSVKLIDDVCQCSVCLERYVEPKLLVCQHCFCKGCLEDLINVHIVDGNVVFPTSIAIVCPNCREVHKLEEGQTLSSLPGNLHLKQVLEVLNKSSPVEDGTTGIVKFRDCGSCPEGMGAGKGTRKCTDCNKFFCGNCVKKEHTATGFGRSEESSHHFIMKIIKSRDGEIISCCIEHNSLLKYFCVNCQILLCTDCVLKSHKIHELQTVDCAAKMLHGNILNNIASVKSNGKNVQAVKTACLEAINNRKTTEESIAFDVRSRKKKILAQISHALDSAEQQVIDDFHNKSEKFVQNVTEKLERVDSFIKQHTDVMDLVDNFEDVNNIEFLCNVNLLKKQSDQNFLSTPEWWMQFITESNIICNGTSQGIPREGLWKMFLFHLELMGCMNTSASTSISQLRDFSPSVLQPLLPSNENTKEMFHQMTLVGSDVENIKSFKSNNKSLSLPHRLKTSNKKLVHEASANDGATFTTSINKEPNQDKEKPVAGEQVEALADYSGEQRGDLNIKKGDILTIVVIWEDGWWTAQTSNGEKGLVPSTLFKKETQSTTTVLQLEHSCSARALYNYMSDGENEISFSAGEKIVDVDRYDSFKGWFCGRAPNGKIGWFPSNYVQFIRGDQVLRKRNRRQTLPV